MHAKQLILFSLTAVVSLAEPVANRMERRQYSSADYNSLLAAASSEMAGASSEMAMLSGMPTLPASVESVLETAIPTSILTNPAAECSALNGKEPDWYKSLPGDVKSALTSYESAISSWMKDHASLFSTGTIAATGLAGCGATSAAAAAATATGTQASATAGAQATGTNAAARPTGAVAAGLAGAIGLMGLVIAL